MSSKVLPPDPDPDDAIRCIWGENITEQMKIHGLSNKGLADHLRAAGVDVTPQAVGQWRSGQTAPRPHVMIAIASVLRASPRALFSLDVIRYQNGRAA